MLVNSINRLPRRWQVETLRVSMYVLALVILCAYYFWQSPFISWSLLGPSFLVLGFGLAIHFLLFFKIDKMTEDSNWLLLTFICDSILISMYVFFSGSSVSLFLLLHMVNIILGSFLFKAKGAIVLALVTSFNYSLFQVLGPDYKSMAALITLGINNLAFFGVAGLSGYLSEKLFDTEIRLKNTEKVLQTLEDLQGVIVDKSPVALITVNEFGEVIQMNTKAVQIFPLIKTKDKFYDFFLPIKNIWQNIIELSANQEFEKELHIDSENDNSIFRLIAKPVSKNQGLYLLMIEDLTVLRKMEFHLKQSEKLAAIGGLAAGVAHEIRNPLAGISGSIELLSQTTQNDDDKKLMKIVLKEINRLNNLITEFLDYAKPAKLPDLSVDLVSVLNEAISNVKSNPLIRSDLRWDVSILDRACVKGDSGKLKQSFLNILINAAQAMDKTASPLLQIELRKDATQIVLRIKDNGCGMNDVTLKRLFEPFYTTKSKGTGLGLAITHKILESHKAKISVRSQLGKGTEFEFNFPCLESA